MQCIEEKKSLHNILVGKVQEKETICRLGIDRRTILKLVSN